MPTCSRSRLVATCKPTNTLSLTGSAGYFSYPGNGAAGSGTIVNPAPAGAGAGPGTGGTAGSPLGAAVPGTLLNMAAFNSADATRNLDLGDRQRRHEDASGPSQGEALRRRACTTSSGGSRDLEEYGLPLTSRRRSSRLRPASRWVRTTRSRRRAITTSLAEYRQVGLGSIDPNLNDSDFNLSRLGFRGIKARVQLRVRAVADRHDDGLRRRQPGQEKDVNIGVANANSSQTIQVDLTAKF